MAPALHYVKIGAAELRDTSPRFQSGALLRLFPKFKPGRDNPVLFLEDLRPMPPDVPGAIVLDVQGLLKVLGKSRSASSTGNTPAVDIIVPVHNNLTRLLPLMETLAHNADPQHTIILIDDASREPGVSDALQSFTHGRSNAHLITNETNLGFAASVNRGLRHSGNHKIILNSDTVVPTGWVDVLTEPILRDPGIASVTPYSNSSSYTGFPENRIELPLAGGADLGAINEALAMFPALDREILSGVGFCMALSARAVEAIGVFDERSFRQGYYEETHWCCRAKHAGFRNVLANRLYVGHDHASSSFGLRRKLSALGRSGRRMRRSFPKYFDEMDRFYFSDPHGDLRRQCCLVVSCRAEASCVAVVEEDHTEWSTESIEHLAAAPANAGSTLLWFHKSALGWELTAHTPRYGAIDLTGTLDEMCELCNALGISRLFCGPSCRPETVTTILGQTAQTAIDVICLKSPDAAAKNETIGPPASGSKLSTAPTVPSSLEEWRALARWPSQRPPFRIAVLGTPPLRTQPGIVRRLIDHVVREDKEGSILVFGEMPDDQLTDPRISKTGIYRFENISAILRHHGINVAYFPNTGDPSFAFTRRNVLSMGLHTLGHEGARSQTAPTVDPRWTVTSATAPTDIYAALEDLYRAHLAELQLPLK